MRASCRLVSASMLVDNFCQERVTAGGLLRWNANGRIERERDETRLVRGEERRSEESKTRRRRRSS